ETNTQVAPWRIIGANRKWHARLEVMRELLKRLDAAAADD
ncbi:MAG: Polyphosphate kinase 2, partial [bacterium]|nr:Polyphosphate kinase 2 [bacterium]